LKKTLDWVQALRGIAALLVVFVHARYFLFGTPNEALAETLFRPGAMGVDLFFMISGFIMVLTTRNSDGSLHGALHFLIKRFARIWPVYAILAVIGVQVYGPFDYYTVPANVIGVVKSLFFLPVDPGKPLYYGLPYGLGWTLNFEMYFYVVFAVAMLAGRFRWLAFFGWLLLTLVAVPYVKRGEFSMDVLHDYHFGFAYLNQASNPMIWTFAAGVVIGLVYQSPARLPNSLGTRCLTAGAIATSIWWAYSGFATFHGLSQWGWPLAVALLVLAVASKSIDINVPRPLLWLGEISFSLYLAHYIAQGVITRILNYYNRHDLTQTWSMIFISTVFALIFGAVSHAILEKRLAEWVRKKLLALILTRRGSLGAEAA
jgi:exopolysaccharide production protein ExoZ